MADRPQVRFFLGANSPAGFYSLYDQFMPPEETEDYLLIKGGPGCGKSTLMRRVAEAMEEAGHPVEYILCSGDPGSLDAVRFPDRKAALVDATAPHVVEPRCPGAMERYVDLGACYDTAALKPLRDELAACMEGYPDCYARAYRCLSAAAQIQDDIRSMLLTPELEARLNKRAAGILSRECRRTGREPGKICRRLLDAVTCQGPMCLFGTADALCRKVYEVWDSYGLAHPLLARLAAGASAAGYDVIVCPDPMDPERLRHVFLPGLGVGFLSSTPGMPYEGKRPYRRLRLDAMLDPERLRRDRTRLRFSRKVADALTAEAVEAMAEAKAKHDALEAVYNPHVDFQRVEETAETIAGELLGEEGGR